MLREAYMLHSDKILIHRSLELRKSGLWGICVPSNILLLDSFLFCLLSFGAVNLLQEIIARYYIRVIDGLELENLCLSQMDFNNLS